MSVSAELWVVTKNRGIVKLSGSLDLDSGVFSVQNDIDPVNNAMTFNVGVNAAFEYEDAETMYKLQLSLERQILERKLNMIQAQMSHRERQLAGLGYGAGHEKHSDSKDFSQLTDEELKELI